MKPWTVAVLLALATATAAAPPAAANHGLTAVIAGALDDGTVVTAVATYVFGNGNSQTWSFEWTTSDGASASCMGFGSIEVGFRSVGCATEWATGPTGDAHAYPNLAPDAHAVAVTFAGVSGTAAQVVEDFV